MSTDEPQDEPANVIPLAPEDAADLSMTVDMFNASPDGKAHTQSVMDRLDALPDGRIEVSGYWPVRDA